jgi:hypothetical protein
VEGGDPWTTDALTLWLETSTSWDRHVTPGFVFLLLLPSMRTADGEDDETGRIVTAAAALLAIIASSSSSSSFSRAALSRTLSAPAFRALTGGVGCSGNKNSDAGVRAGPLLVLQLLPVLSVRLLVVLRLPLLFSSSPSAAAATAAG